MKHVVAVLNCTKAISSRARTEFHFNGGPEDQDSGSPVVAAHISIQLSRDNDLDQHLVSGKKYAVIFAEVAEDGEIQLNDEEFLLGDTATTIAEEIEALEEESDEPTEALEALTREEIKDRLDQRGIEYNQRAKTDKLLSLLLEAIESDQEESK